MIKKTQDKAKSNGIVSISIILGLMCFLLTAGIYIQINTVKNSGTSVAKTTAENGLRDSVLRMKQRYENTDKQLKNKEKELEDLINAVAKNDVNIKNQNDELNRLNKIIGLTEVEGEGVIVTLADGIAPENSLLVADYLVHDYDLIFVVNELFNAGAEAISINGVRIVSTSGITCAGNIIKINDEKVGTPFKIKAIGSKDMLYGSLKRSGGYLDNLENAGVEVEVTRKDLITIDRYTGIFKFDNSIPQ